MKVQVKGIRTTLDALKDLDNDVRKDTLKGLRESANALRDEAQDLAPDGQPLRGWKGWRGGYSKSMVVGGIKTTTAKRRKRGSVVSNVMGVQNTTAAGVIWELAGRKSDGASPRAGKNPRTGHSYGNGRSFVAKIRSESGMSASRLVWGAYDSPQKWNAETEADKIVELVDKATKVAQAKLGAYRG